MPLAPSTPCPCGRPLDYARCCARWHAGPEALRAPTAEDLMRSRYSAFVGELLDYLRDTWHPSTRPAAIEPMPAGLRWLGLDVRRHVQQDADHAIVEFVARSKRGGKAERLHETSRFVREDGHWFYVDDSPTVAGSSDASGLQAACRSGGASLRESSAAFTPRGAGRFEPGKAGSLPRSSLQASDERQRRK